MQIWYTDRYSKYAKYCNHRDKSVSSGGSMPRASEAPFAPDIVRCSKSWTTVDAERCLQCSPTNSHLEEDSFASDHQEEDGFRERSPERRRRMSSRGIAP